MALGLSAVILAFFSRMNSVLQIKTHELDGYTQQSRRDLRSYIVAY